jgi:hypothetical protein
LRRRRQLDPIGKPADELAGVGRRNDPGLAQGAADHLLPAPGLVDQVARAG